MSKNLPQKICAQCGRPFDWRKKWERCWDEVRYCSERCKGEAKRQKRREGTSMVQHLPSIIPLLSGCWFPVLTSQFRLFLLPFVFCLLPLLSGCHRTPATAAELREHLPRRWQGEIRLKDESAGRRVGIELRELTVRSEHVLEFNRVRWQAFAGNETLAEDEAAVRGTIRTPGGEIRLDPEGTNVGEMLKTGTFEGTLSGDLQSVEATWTTDTDQKTTITLKAVSK